MKKLLILVALFAIVANAGVTKEEIGVQQGIVDSLKVVVDAELAPLKAEIKVQRDALMVDVNAQLAPAKEKLKEKRKAVKDSTGLTEASKKLSKMKRDFWK
jgi:hypothetical protein